MTVDITDRYAVFGNPVSHSKSPLIHAEFARQTGQILQYTAELVEKNQFAQAVAAFQANNGKGLNITVPFKQDAFQLVHELSPRAQRAGAVNTLLLRDKNNYYGDTTDGAGLLNDLTRNHHLTLSKINILVLGAGGAVRGILEPLLAQTPAQLIIANRTVVTATQLAHEFSDLGQIEGCGYPDLNSRAFDLIINGTSASLQGELPPLHNALVSSNTVIYDMMYGKQDSPFMNWGRQLGAALVLDGLGMLVEQAAESFYIWRGVRPHTAPVINTLRQKIKP